MQPKSALLRPHLPLAATPHPPSWPWPRRPPRPPTPHSQACRTGHAASPPPAPHTHHDRQARRTVTITIIHHRRRCPTRSFIRHQAVAPPMPLLQPQPSKLQPRLSPPSTAPTRQPSPALHHTTPAHLRRLARADQPDQAGHVEHAGDERHGHQGLCHVIRVLRLAPLVHARLDHLQPGRASINQPRHTSFGWPRNV